jgi:glycosyltransferase involved in cell wall biosynthesis
MKGWKVKMNLSLKSDNKIKIMRIIARLIIGGPTIHVVLLNSSLNNEIFESVLVCGSPNPGEQPMLDFALEHHIKPIAIPEIVGEATFKPRDVKALAKVFRLIRQERPHIVHTHTAKAGFIGRLAARLAGVPVILHTYHGHVLHGYYSPLKTWLLRHMEQVLGYFTDCIIAVSKQVKQDLVSYGVASPEKITVIPLGFDLEPFLSCQKYRGELRRELGLSDAFKLVGIVGRVFPIKNHRLFLDAAARVLAGEPAARFIIVGDGVLRFEVERHARELGIADKVIFTGWRRDLPRIYADLNALVISSDNEGTPVSAIEAMAAGVPVVGTKVGGVPDLITDGETGYLVPPRDPDLLANAILRLIRGSETTSFMSQAARSHVTQRYPVRRLISDMECLYQNLLLKKGVAI